ncbi:uncharacterized protein METZ01_LOCUS263906 [marine metagenome]|uniref:Uncharacterized protein n=1 Tax=marine metagenome TaxID=408172 RepID=A0A382JI57_9ZZZZ
MGVAFERAPLERSGGVPMGVAKTLAGQESVGKPGGSGLGVGAPAAG